MASPFKNSRHATDSEHNEDLIFFELIVSQSVGHQIQKGNIFMLLSTFLRVHFYY